ncbi:hypothetical protein FIBSPDRAFT_881619 [Athelia psychrophila]|uniref:Uncharacterized protein n=1 Tax=Athelia psychrophila TaxID=1759441 RepID=A0A166W625_9AGAM|nr:hypothetical protein FIBSPDRAFT_881619 [Fibularhizoctonia sp. CBS 109695]
MQQLALRTAAVGALLEDQAKQVPHGHLRVVVAYARRQQHQPPAHLHHPRQGVTLQGADVEATSVATSDGDAVVIAIPDNLAIVSIWAKPSIAASDNAEKHEGRRGLELRRAYKPFPKRYPRGTRDLGVIVGHTQPSYFVEHLFAPVRVARHELGGPALSSLVTATAALSDTVVTDRRLR